MNSNYYIGDSNIHGKGVISAKNLKVNEVIGLGIGFEYYFIPYVTEYLGSFVNHSYNPTAYLDWVDSSIAESTSRVCRKDKPGKFLSACDKITGWYIKVLKPLKKDEEITLNYDNTPWYIQKPLPHYI